MRWGAFCSNVLVSGNMDSKQYTDMLTEHFLEDFISYCRKSGNFPTRKSPNSCVKAFKSVFSDKNVLMDWPALSPDLNPIENLWGIVARQNYSQGKQYDSKVSLTWAIMKSWSEIEDQTVKSLIGSMKNRCIEVIAAKGGKTKKWWYLWFYFSGLIFLKHAYFII